VRADVAATKLAWPRIVHGLAPRPGPLARAAIALAGERSAAIGTPGVFAEKVNDTLTGPGSGIAGELRGASVLAARSWQMIGAAVEQIEHGSPHAASFARANVALYVEGVYDSHFTLAHIGKQVADDYEKLGGQSSFGTALTQQQVDALARTYSEPVARLYPHETVKLGS
jgi:hypothetical protein